MSTLHNDIFLAVHSCNPLEETVERITGAIKARLLSPGDRLPAERDLSAQLGVSRSTLRVALQMLTEVGWLEVRRGRHGGSFVARWPRMPHPRKLSEVLARRREDLPALLDYRRAVECAAALFAAERATPEDIRELEQLDTVMCENRSDYEAYRTADARFHIGIARAAHSPRIMQSVTEVQAAMTEVLDVIIYQTKDRLISSARCHNQIITAIRDHDAERAHVLMLEHVRYTESIIHNLADTALAEKTVAA